jgi:hypothetical protein
MRPRSTLALGALGLAVAVSPLAGCGGGENEPAKPLGMHQVARSLERQSTAFLDREGTALHRGLDRFLGGRITTEVSKGSTECRSGKETASISDPKRYPFACIVEGNAAGNGLTVNITLGFVGLDLDGHCWRAANERISVTTGAPALVTHEEADRPVNQVRACV